ncbi:VOC family protein [Klenkia sp. LSe6-5]|uniref:VOC family protein n=1 Tax=Klenkia sesuvii TaxID=3103137 RepID=A0ABU8DTT8_9ACTN
MTAPARFKDLCLDARDHHALADWWCTAMGYVRRDELHPADDGWVRPVDWPVPIVDPAGHGPMIWLVPVADEKVVKNRMHHDVVGDTQRLLDLGATLVRGDDRRADGELTDWRAGDIEWDVLADPEGNEFCCFAP